MGITGKLIREPVTGTTGATAGRVTTLNHEMVDHPVEGDTVIETFAGEKNKIVNRIGCFCSEQVYFDRTSARLYCAAI